MADYPQFDGVDGTPRQVMVLSTTLDARFFTGTIPETAVDVQVSLRGAPFSSDPSLISFEGSRFTLPNPSTYPDGLSLLPGLNVFRVRATLLNGSTTQEATATITRVTDDRVSPVAIAPAGIVVERRNASVFLQVQGITGVSSVVGYHAYASPSPGGGLQGYFRVNPQLLLTGDPQETVTSLATLEAEALVPLDTDDLPVADPLFFRLRGGQEDRDGAVLSSDFDEILEVGEDVRRLRVTTTVSSVTTAPRFSFEHDRLGNLTSALPAIPHSALATVPQDLPLFYVFTAVHVIDGVEVESHFSPEVAASPLRITPQIGSFPQVARQDILRQMVSSIYRTNPAVRIDPGSALRDTVLDPFSTEADRIRFVIDFLHNAQSFATLLLIDDPTLSGQSTPVSQSAYKTALREAFFLSSDAAVQDVIDSAFDKLASQFGVIRDGGRRARGEVTFYVTSRPTASITRPLGTLVRGGGYNYRTTSSAVIVPTGVGGSYSPTTGRYFARAFVQAEEAGSGPNLAAGQVRSLPSGNGVQVVNESAFFGGTDRESNRDLAQRAMRVLSSVDSGTSAGYRDTVLRVAGISQALVVSAGDPLMKRDLDASAQHIGGTVDIYVRGSAEARVTDNFVFSYQTRTRQQFEPVGDLTNLHFRAVDKALTPSNPIVEMLHLDVAGQRLENITQGRVFNLTNARLVAYDTIALDPNYNDPITHTLYDEIRGSYRFLESNRYTPSRQPVTRVLALAGDSAVAPDQFSLTRAHEILYTGNSTQAGDYVTLLDDGSIPVITPAIEVTDEPHVILNAIEYLDNLGAYGPSVRVYNADRSVEYYGPYSTTPDFDVTPPTDARTPLAITLTPGSRISEGQRVLVDYSHVENFTLTYQYDALVAVAQEAVNDQRHITANVLVKAAVPIPVDISATVALLPNSNANAVDSRIRASLARLFNALAMGAPVRQSDIIRAIDEVQGVSYVVTPLTRMTPGDGALILREPLDVNSDNDSLLLTAWSGTTVSTWLLKNPLTYATSDAGGPTSVFRAVFQHETPLQHQETAPGGAGFPLRGGVARSFIIGSQGMDIPGWSDDATLTASLVLPSDPDLRASQLLSARVARTANCVLVTLPPGKKPSEYKFSVTYVVVGSSGVQNVSPGALGYLTLGDVTILFDEDT